MQTQDPQEVSTSMEPALLVSATYDNNRKSAVLKFYDPKTQSIKLWYDRTGHKPYCYSKRDPHELDFLNDRDDVYKIEQTKRLDLLTDSSITVSKIIVEDPLAIGGTQSDKSIRNIIETWESDIKYYENYMYDNTLIVGKYYEISDGEIKPHDMEISDEVRLALKSLLWDKLSNDHMVDPKQFQEFISEWAELLNQPIPPLRRLSFDIEVEAEIGRIPDAKIAEKKVTAIGFEGSDNFKKVLVLKKKGQDKGDNPLPPDVEVIPYEEDEEKKMIEEAFRIIESYPFVITFNGDDFDMPYLYNRAQRLGIKNSENPLYMMRDSATLKKGVHIDLYRTFSNRSFQIYAFSNRYTDFSLNSISKALLNEEKIDYGEDLNDLNLYQLAHYCYNDARLTYRLTSFNNNILMDLLVVIARIARMPIDDIARMGVSQWIRSLLYYEHRKHGALIPKREELERKSAGVTADAIIKDKKYRGGLVVDPKEGIHFNVTVMDFASLYPSIIKVKNISYETVRCPHKECKENKIPDTNHWICTKKNGLTALIIGSLRDLRVNYYKSLSKNEALTEEQRQQYTVVSQALKVILNASYGVMGAEIFPLYFLPAAEATTAIGRHIILQTIKKCEKLGVKVLYGDSVLPDTPIVIQDKKGTTDIVPIQSLIPKTVTATRYHIDNVKVLTDRGFTKIKYVYKHKVKKKGYRIVTKRGFVECTDDHSLVIGGRRVRPSELKVGDRIDLVPLRTKGTANLNSSLAWLFGVFMIKGTCKVYRYKNKEKSLWRLENDNKKLLQKAKKIIEEDLGLETLNIKKGSSSYILVPKEDSKLLVEYFAKQFYRNKEKVVPQRILNSKTAAKRSFIRGIQDSRQRHHKNKTIAIDRLHKTAQAGIAIILDELGIGYTVQKDRKACKIIIKGKGQTGQNNIIEKIETFIIDDYVYDLETHNHHFCGGIGNVLLHNTDSLFIKNPTKEQIQMVINEAKKDHGVELEVDKEYRYVVLSSRKKNYLGVTKNGKVDVKGLTGKKSHTPPFIKKLFYELLDILAKVQTEEEFELAKKQISEKIAQWAKKVESKEIPLEDLAFNVMISKAPSEYVKTVPQHIRAAKLLESIREIKKGDIISYVKILNKPGVKPVEMARRDEIDSKKYMEFMESTLDQITSSMGLDFDTILGKPKQTGLDQFFWN